MVLMSQIIKQWAESNHTDDWSISGRYLSYRKTRVALHYNIEGRRVFVTTDLRVMDNVEGQVIVVRDSDLATISMMFELRDEIELIGPEVFKRSSTYGIFNSALKTMVANFCPMTDMMLTAMRKESTMASSGFAVLGCGDILAKRYSHLVMFNHARDADVAFIQTEGSSYVVERNATGALVLMGSDNDAIAIKLKYKDALVFNLRPPTEDA
jgi:hypothetical protein